jgi:hypothetical protein
MFEGFAQSSMTPKVQDLTQGLITQLALAQDQIRALCQDIEQLYGRNVDLERRLQQTKALIESLTEEMEALRESVGEAARYPDQSLFEEDRASRERALRELAEQQLKLAQAQLAEQKVHCSEDARLALEEVRLVNSKLHLEVALLQEQIQLLRKERGDDIIENVQNI